MITWTLFQERFLEKYFPEDVRENKEMEFLTLTQGSMNVGEYAAKFEELSRYHPHYHNAINERPRCVKFVNGLRPEIKEAIRMQEIQKFSTLVNRCRIFEEDHKARIAKFREHRSESSGTKNYGSQRNQMRGFGRGQPYQRQQHQRGPTIEIPQNRGNSGNYMSALPRGRCFACGGEYYRKDCPVKPLICFSCKKPRHMSRDCPMVKKEGDGGNRNYNNQNPSGGVASKPKAHGKVFAMSGKEASHSDIVIGGTCIIRDTLLSVVFDSSASHSFISTSCVEQLRLPTIALPFDLSVHTPSNDPVITAKACWDCPISIDGRNFVVNLFCLPLKGLEVILGLDWLSDNHVIIDCCRKTIVFRDFEHDNSEQLRIQSANYEDVTLKEEVRGLVMCLLVEEKEEKLDDLPVVRKFPDVFPDDISGLLPE
ncbi:uncharacterized protein LOC113854297 [Abrus precatorius]|uniref:Uncharacterized protein LOC113854297 n=1 Tax=Abrus precatorius TaxID=3816 RepID=A0A8B8KCV2_ABRPR|nr:uncharacterized protein LOC113854297 [Abrus precatorius]